MQTTLNMDSIVLNELLIKREALKNFREFYKSASILECLYIQVEREHLELITDLAIKALRNKLENK